MTTTLLSTLKIIAITALLSAAACNDTNSTAEASESMTNNDSSVNQLTPAASTVMNVEGTGTVESRQIQGTDGAGGAPGSDAVMSGSESATSTGSGTATGTPSNK